MNFRIAMILLIDSYDSFSNNLRNLIEKVTGEEIRVIQNDSIRQDDYQNEFLTWIRYCKFIVIGPGPGNPANAKDTGIIKWLLQLFKREPNTCIPTLGVCLGFQSICYEFGNRVNSLDSIRHGQIFDIITTQSELFDEGVFGSVRYHSLGIEMDKVNECILPLAYCQDESKKILMAGKHKEYPLYGVQYHPESICSSKGDVLISKFNDIASEYNKQHRKYSTSKPDLANLVGNQAKHASRPINFGGSTYVKAFSPLDSGLNALDIADHLYKQGEPFFLLYSASSPGEWSFIGLPIKGHSLVVTHSTNCPESVEESLFGEAQTSKKKQASSGVWPHIKSFMTGRFRTKVDLASKFGSETDVPPFVGGFMGLFSYEEGLHVEISPMETYCDSRTPDTKLIFIERFIVHNRLTKKWHIVSIKADDEDWLNSFTLKLDGSNVPKILKLSVPTTVKELIGCGESAVGVHLPDKDIYEKQFNKCQAYLKSGDLYELCLTTQLKVFVPRKVNAWEMFKILSIHKNPSPYSSYMDFDDCILVSSSPERFLSWKLESSNQNRRRFEFRPIKGTVKKEEGVDFADAEKILRTAKEMGENLMIVDLIRHDLSTFSDDVVVSSLMSVEEYETVYQLVSVIQGSISEQGCHSLDVLASSLPPGSMTGAPKKRSVQLLQELESAQQAMKSKRRGLYSGIAGYWSVTDEADWSVTIRSMFHYKDDKENDACSKVWRIGAGGAITVLSEKEAEWEEMMVKLRSTLRIFI